LKPHIVLSLKEWFSGTKYIIQQELSTRQQLQGSNVLNSLKLRIDFANLGVEIVKMRNWPEQSIIFSDQFIPRLTQRLSEAGNQELAKQVGKSPGAKLSSNFQ